MTSKVRQWVGDPVVLYDRFYEAGTALAGVYYNQLYNASAPEDEDFWEEQVRALDAERYAVEVDDSAEQLGCIERWTRVENQINRLSHIQSSTDVPISTIREKVVARLFPTTPLQESFVLMSVGGQPGAGKTTALRRILGRYTHPPVPILGDDLRPLHPQFSSLRKDPDPERMPAETAALSGQLVEEALSYAAGHNHSAAVEGTWRRPEVTLGTLSAFAAAGAQTHAVVLAVPAAVSWQGCLARYLDALDRGEGARFTPESAHDVSYNAVATTLMELEDSPVVHRISVCDRAGTIVYDNQRDADQRWLRPPHAVDILTETRHDPAYLATFHDMQQRLEEIAQRRSLGSLIHDGLAYAKNLADELTSGLSRTSLVP